MHYLFVLYFRNFNLKISFNFNHFGGRRRGSRPRDGFLPLRYDLGDVARNANIENFIAFVRNANIRGYPNNDWLIRSPESDDNFSNFGEDNVYVPLRKRNSARLLYDHNNQRSVHIFQRASFHFKGITNNMLPCVV